MTYERMTKEELVEELQKFQNSLRMRKVDLDQTDRLLHELQVQQIELEMQNRELREAQQRLEESRDKYSDLYDFSPVGYMTLNEKGVILEINLTLAAMLGIERTRLSGQSFLSFVYQEDIKKYLDHLRHASSSNQKIITELRLKIEKEDPVYVQLLSIHDGNEKKILKTAVTDITQLKEAFEKEEKMTRQIQALKMEAVGTLAGGIAHDFNNLLTGIIGNASLAKAFVSPEDPVYKFLVHLETASMKTKDLTQQLLTFARGGAPIKETASMKELIRDSVHFVLRGSAVQPDFVLEEDLWSVEADIGQINQVLNNLVINALQAMPKGGILKVRAENFQIKEKVKLFLDPGQFIKITIKDSGPGISKKNMEHIFEPYFSTKQGGHGLGLATAYSIIQKHGGLLTVNSKEGFGTTFSIYLPATENRAISKKEDPQYILMGTGKILVMDDEEIVRDIAREMLIHLGYEVLFAKEGEEAIALYKEASASGEPFQAVILDLTIPGGMGGKETVTHLMALNPEVKAIVSSGYSKDAIMSDFKAYGFIGVIAKPYRLIDLSQIIYQVLHSQLLPPIILPENP